MTTRDELLHVMGMREAAEIVRNFRPKSTCTCGNYSVPNHQPGCLFGECQEIAEEIEARADEREIPIDPQFLRGKKMPWLPAKE